jgi:DNA-binding LacI/PurR family transcriptional regulator
MAATLHDVARVASVSIKTVSNVINDYPHIRPQTKQRVLDAIEELGYSPNMTARSLRSGRTGVIGLAVPELSLSYFAELADAVIKAADSRGVTVLIEQTDGDRKRMGADDAELLRVKYPLVLLGERIFGGPTDHVTMQNVDAARAATAHLIASGRRRIAVVGAHEGEVIGSAGLRLRGYREALDDAGIPFDPRLVSYTTLWHRANGAASMRALLDSGVQFDSVFGLNDTLALGAIRVLQEVGLRVPVDVGVIGFDDIDEAKYSIPTLSSIDPGREHIAATAVDVLLDRIAHPASAEAPREIAAEFRVVERESSRSSA